MRTVKGFLKHELRMVNLDISHCEDMIRSEVTTYYEKVWEKRKRKDEKYRDEIKAIIQILRSEKKTETQNDSERTR